MATSVQSLIVLGVLQILEPSATVTLEGLRLVSTTGCDCAEETLIYECTVLGSPQGSTIWTGRALNCPSDEIVFFHQRFEGQGTIRSCNFGATVAQSLHVQNDFYTSRLNITITPNNISTLACMYEVMGNTRSHFSTQIPGPLPSPIDLHISTANFILKTFSFSWSPVASDCLAIHYNILASNCGSCPTTTNHTNVTCTDVPSANNITCAFSVQTVACGNIYGNRSDPIYLITNINNQIISKGNTNSVSALIAGGVMLFIAVMLILGCIAYEVIKRKVTCSIFSNQLQGSLQDSTLNSEEVGNATYSLCDRGSNKCSINRHTSGQPTWKDITDNQQLGNSMTEYSCLNKHSIDKGNDIPLSKLPRKTRSLSKPQSLYSEDVYDKTTHKNWTMNQ